MQKQLILCMSVPARTTRAKYEMTAAIKEIRGIDHLICDLYNGKIKLARYVVSDKEYGKFLYLENRWSQDVKYYSDIRFFGEYEGNIFPKTAVSDETIKVLKKYGIKAPVNSTYARMVNEKMNDIRYAKEKEREKLQDAETQRLFGMVPKIPKEFITWAKSLFDHRLLSLIYKRETKYRAVVTCCRCGQTPTIRTNSVSPNVKTIPVPKDGQLGECQWCHANGKYSPHGRYKSNRLNENCYLFQSLSDGGLLVRYFELQLREYYGGHEIEMLERSRIFLNINTKTKTFWNHTYYGDGRECWKSYNVAGTSSYYLGSGPIFRGYDDAVENSSLAYADYKAYAYTATFANYRPHTDDYIDALSAYAYFPKIEYLYKSGYEVIVRHLVNTHSITSLINKKGKSIPEMLKIKSSRVGYIKGKNKTLNYLEALQFECKNNLNLSDDEIEWMVKMSGRSKFYDDLVKLLKLMTFRKLYNRVREYAVKEYKDSDVNSWIAFRDYMIMREELGYDMTNSVYLHPHSLRNAHAEMVAENERRKNEKYISEKMQKFTQIPERYKKLKKKYSMESNGYLFIPAHDAGEIVIEGRTLHHCVGSSDIYMGRHDRGEGAIIFMRNISAPNVPYVTIEINIKDQKILQWYGAHDKKPQEEATLNAIHDFEMLLESLKAKKKKAAKAAADDIAQPVLMPAAV